MIFTGFKRKSNQIFFNKRLKQLIENPNQDTSSKIKNILVFLDDVSIKSAIKKELSKKLSISENEIKLVIFQQKVKKGAVIEDVISPFDFGWYGKLKSETVKAILTKKYDLLINYSKVDNLYSNLLLLQCNSAFRIGFSHLDNRFYDISIDCDLEKRALFNSEVKKYLEILKKI